MEPIEYDKMADAEEGHWWFVHQRHLVHALLAQLYGATGPGQPLHILDCGCGTGAVSRELSRYGSVRAIVRDGLASQWSEGPGGVHWENITGNYTEFACGIATKDGEVTITQDFY